MFPRITAENPSQVVGQLSARLIRSQADPRPIALMTCGIAGAGKTALSREILNTHPSFKRNSIDEIIASKHGLYKIDFDPKLYEQYQNEADGIFRSRLSELLKDGGSNVILDRSFYAKADRDEFKDLVERWGARWVLVYLKVERDVLWRRICERREKGMDANSALEITEEVLKGYVDGFEEPMGEGEVVVEWVE